FRFERNLRIAHANHNPYSYLTMTTNAILNLTELSEMARDNYDQQWQAMLARNANEDGKFVFAVSSTGIYCRPSCPSKRPRRENVAFFRRPDDAERAGYRACLRCRPRSIAGNPQTELVKKVCRYIERHLDEPITLSRLGKEFRQSPFHLQRTFKAVLGITPRAYADSCRLNQLKSQLRAGHSVTRAMYDAGYSSSSRLYERTASQLGMTPDKYRRGAIAAPIRYTITDSPLGRLLIAATDKGICTIQFADSDEELEHGLRHEFPFATRRRDDEAMASWKQSLLRQMRGQKLNRTLPLDIQATAFQRRVWDHLQTIPFGSTQSYGQVAKAIGQPTASRAVARACATNPVAVAIPCHRIIREDGDPGGYRWGIERKKTLLSMEKESAEARA
ncbi:MAG TPA: bifunctional DNA-binding transcriptional regulator/O6-methylguanine-DNA methyltransferase Ada, partial [Terracidiphilus sp.]|nr:bifunctional DNA-binding transcriptional regulator/O6-methylguanine-DNA methyltransferase Ada [Terracidiphilus sp.]